MKTLTSIDLLVELSAAYHEVGHAVAARHGGLHLTHCELQRAPDGVAATGVTFAEPPAPGDPVAAWDAFAVFLFAGIAAQSRHALQIGRLTRPVARGIEQAAAGDLEHWGRARRATSLSERQARAAADRLVRAQWTRIERFARRLAAEHYLPGSAL